MDGFETALMELRELASEADYRARIDEERRIGRAHVAMLARRARADLGLD